MVQPQYNNIYSSENGMIPGWFWRNKLTVKANYYKYIPYAAFEMYYQFANPSGNGFVRNRYFIGTGIPISPRSIFEIYYAIEQNYNQRSVWINKYVVGIGYELTL